jgi:hypothetical protein
MLEFLFIEPILKFAHWDTLRKELKKLITKGAFIPYSAYVRSQLNKAKHREPIGKRAELIAEMGYDTKFMSHTARLAVQCVCLMETGEIPVRVPEPFRSEILKIKLGQVTKDEATIYCEDLDVKMHQAYQKTHLPESVNINKFEKDVFIPLMRSGLNN